MLLEESSGGCSLREQIAHFTRGKTERKMFRTPIQAFIQTWLVSTYSSCGNVVAPTFQKMIGLGSVRLSRAIKQNHFESMAVLEITVAQAKLRTPAEALSRRLRYSTGMPTFHRRRIMAEQKFTSLQNEPKQACLRKCDEHNWERQASEFKKEMKFQRA